MRQARKADEPIRLFVGIALLIGLLGYLDYPAVASWHSVVGFIGGFGRLAGLIILLRHGTLLKRQSVALRLLLALLGLLCIGMLLKVMHWPGGHTTTLAGLGLVPLLYGVHFGKKPVRTRLDYLKLAWVILLSASLVCVFQHCFYKAELLFAQQLLFLILYADFIYVTGRAERKLPR